MSKCSLTIDNGAIAVRAPYDAGFVAALKTRVQPTERRWKGETKQWLVSNRHGKTVQDLCLGEPNDESEALKIAKTYRNRIDTIFVGPEGGSGQVFLNQLAKASGGQHVTADRVKELAQETKKLLAA